MYRGHTVAVVLPAYNEAKHVGGVLDSLPAFVDRVYAVDDHSTDATWEILREHATVETVVEKEAPLTQGLESTDVVPLRHDTNQGAGAALKTGYKHALADGADITVAMDADGQMDPDQMYRLLDPIVDGTAEYTKGDRLASPRSRSAMPPVRLLGNWTLTLLTKVSSGYWGIRDPQNGYTAITSAALRTVDVDALPQGHDYPNALLTRLNVAGVRVVDVEIPAVYGDESSTINYHRFVPRTSTTLLRSMVWRLNQQHRSGGSHPFVALYTAGTAIGVLGIAGGLWILWWTLSGSTAAPNAGGVVASLFGASVLLAAAIFLDAREARNREVVRR